MEVEQVGNNLVASAFDPFASSMRRWTWMGMPGYSLQTPFSGSFGGAWDTASPGATFDRRTYSVKCDLRAPQASEDF